MKVRVRVVTTMEYESVVEALTEADAVRQAKLDALLVDGYDYKGQFAEWERVDNSTTVSDPDKISRINTIKSAVERNKKIQAVLDEDED